MAAMLFCDSFDHYLHAQMSRKWNVPHGGTFVAGRTGTALRFGAAEGWGVKTFNAEYSTLTMGIAHKTTAYANAPIRFVNAINSVQFDLAHVGDGRFRFTFGASGGSGSSSPSTWVMNLNQWYYLEVQAEITTASPPHVIASARVNGAEILAWDYTHGSSIAMNFNGVTMVPPGGGTTGDFDDLYVTDGEFLGDVKIGVLYPNAAGDSSAWTSSVVSGSSYDKPGGKGNREGMITITTSASLLSGAATSLINGNYTDFTYIVNGANAGRWLTFDFVTPIAIDEVTLFREFAVDYGTWQWYGSNNGSTWTALGPAQTSWTSAANAVNSLGGNTTSYRYYKFEGVSGSLLQTYNREFEFRIYQSGDNWEQVNEHPAVDDDATYVSAATVGLKDLYNLDDIDPAFTGTIKGVQALWAVKKSDEGDGAIKGVWKSGATEIVQAAGHNFLAPDGFYPSAADYIYDIQTERKSLFTAADWTKAEISALQLGITRTL